MNDKHQPSNPLDLDAALVDIATSASASAADGPAGTAEVHRLVKRSRRQRATAFGSAGFVLLGVAGVGLSGLLSPAPVEVLPAPPVLTPAPTPTPTSAVVTPLTGTLVPACGDDLSEIAATTAPLVLEPDPSGAADGSPLQVTSTADAPLTLSSTGTAAVYLLDAQGTVVSTSVPPESPADGEGAASFDLDPGASGELGLQGIGPCGDAALPAAGTWKAVGMLGGDITRAGGVATSGTLVGGPWEVTIDDAGNLTSLDGHPVAVVEAEPETPPEAPEPPTYLPGAFDREEVTFPAPLTMDENLQCGQAAPAATSDDLLARLEIVGPVPVTGGTSQPSITARVTTHAHARLESFGFDDEYVISQNGVIVSSPLIATDFGSDVEMQPGSVRNGRFILTGTASCDPYGGSAPQPLPPGTYQLHATYAWLIDSYSLQQTDGTWGRTIQRGPAEEPLFKGNLVSPPVTFTVQ